MAIVDFTAEPFEQMIDAFAKSLTHTPVTKTLHPVTGDETLTDGTAVTLSAAFFLRENAQTQAKEALFEGADAILMAKVSVTTLNKNDKITYDGDTYRILRDPIKRRLGTIGYYWRALCFKI